MRPTWPQDDGLVKTSAAWLIERAGFTKGYGNDRVRLSSRHTLAITNRGGPPPRAELLDLAREIRDGVDQRFGIALVNEPVLVNCCPVARRCCRSMTHRRRPAPRTRSAASTPMASNTVPTMPVIIPALAVPSPPSRPWEAWISLTALRPRPQAKGEITKPSPHRKPMTRPTIPRISARFDCG